jgi:alpha-1,2-mannosyltransferase
VTISGLLVLKRLHASGKLASEVTKGRAAALLVALLMLALAEPLRAPFQDFIDAYYRGGASILAHESIDEMYGQGVNGFVNVPIVGALFVPFALLPSRLASLLYLGLGLVALGLALRRLCELARLDPYRSAIVGLLLVTNGPLMNSLKEGNTSHFALLALVLALLSLRQGQPFRAGLLLGAVTIFKLPIAIFGLWAVLRGRIKMALGMGLVLAGTAAASMLVFGVEAHVTWYQRFVASSSQQPIAAFNVQSFPALIVRWDHAAQVLCNWDGFPLDAGRRRLASVCSLLLMLGVAGSALVARWRGRESAGAAPGKHALELEFSMVALLACATSPLAWSHYYGWALLPIALLLSPTGPLAERASAAKAVFIAAVVLLSLPVVWPWCSPSPLLARPYSLLVSHYLFGAILLLGLLVTLRATRITPDFAASNPGGPSPERR